MAKSSKTSPVTETPTPEVDNDLPVIPFLSMHKTPKGYVVLRIKVQGRIADDKENVLGASYEVEFPYGDITFALGKRELKANIFGYKGELINFPAVLDKMLSGPVRELEEAAANVGDVAEKIRRATRFRAVAQGFLLASRTSTKKAVQQLMKQYDIGLSDHIAEKIVVLADATTAQITRKPRYYGLAGGLALVAALDALYYLLPVRSRIASFLPAPKFDVILDILPLALCAFLTTFCISRAGASRGRGSWPAAGCSAARASASRERCSRWPLPARARPASRQGPARLRRCVVWRTGPASRSYTWLRVHR